MVILFYVECPIFFIVKVLLFLIVKVWKRAVKMWRARTQEYEAMYKGSPSSRTVVHMHRSAILLYKNFCQVAELSLEQGDTGPFPLNHVPSACRVQHAGVSSSDVI